MMDINSKIALIEEEIRQTPYHKATEHYIGRLKAKLAKLRALAIQSKKTGGRLGFALPKSGDATVVLIGPPSVGKSTLLNKLTHAQARVAPWPFTTLSVIPGMMDFRGAKIQIFDLPGIIGGATRGIGRGKEVLSVARTADLLLLMVDIKTRNRVNLILREIKGLEIDLPVLVVINKVDLIKDIPKKISPDWLFVSAEKEIGLEELKKMIWQRLSLMRVYLKLKDKKPDFTKPLILRNGQAVTDVAKKIFPQEKKFQRILLWGPSAQFPRQEVSLTRQLKDGDILSFG